MSKWQDISTASQSEDDVIWLWDGDARYLGVWVTARAWSEGRWKILGEIKEGSVFLRAGVSEFTPTHWMPLPEPPQ